MELQVLIRNSSYRCLKIPVRQRNLSMKRFHVFLIAMTLLVASLLHLACAYAGPHYPTIYGTSTATPYPNAAVTVIGATPYSINPIAVTISAGDSVTFVNNTAVAHNLLPDNGSGTACGLTAYPLAASPASVTIPFATTGTYNVHCTIHTGCSNSAACLGCTTGMYETVVVQ